MDTVNGPVSSSATGPMGAGSTNPADVLPLSLLPVSLAKDTLIAQYITVGTLAVFCWDIITHLDDDFKLLTKFKIKLPTIVYFLARIASFAEVLGNAIFVTAPVESCSRLAHFTSIINVVAVACNSFLFFLRIKAIFSNSLPVIVLFLLLWVMITAGGATPLIGLTVANIRPTSYCTNTGVPKFVSLAMWTAVIFDGSVFTAISARLLANSYGNRGLHVESETRSNDNGSRRSWKSSWVKGFFFGTGLPRFSKALLKDGQSYYLVVTAINITVLVLIYAKGPVWTVSFAQTDMFLTNSLTSHVFRKTKFGIFSSDLSSASTTGHESGRQTVRTSHFHPSRTMSIHFQPHTSELVTNSRWTGGSMTHSLSANARVGHPRATSSIKRISDAQIDNELLRPSATGAAAAVASVAMSISSPRSAIFMSKTSESKDISQDLSKKEKDMDSDDDEDFKDVKKRMDSDG